MISLNHRQWSTPATIAAGVFMSVSGVLIFFGMHDPVQLAHKWVGLAFVAFVGFHIATHWRGFKGYFSQRVALGIIALVAVVTLSIVVLPGGPEGGDMRHRLFHSLERAPLSEVAPLLDETPESLAAKLQSAGFKVTSTVQSIEEIATHNGTRAPELWRFVFE